MKKISLQSGLFSVIFALASCGARHSEKEIEDAMTHYDRLIYKMDADSIALLYTNDGDLGTVAHGRDTIRKFLSSFKNVRVLSQSSITTSIEMKDDTAYQKGTYAQVALMNGKDTLHANGTYAACWHWIPQEGWRIKKMETQPEK